MTEPLPEGGCCRCVTSFVITSGFTALFMWLSLRASNPTCSIEQFYVSTLNKTSNSHSNNHTISYDLKLNNRNNDKGIYYDALNLTFYYKPNLTHHAAFPIGNGSYYRFYQGRGKSTHRVGGVNWEKDVFDAVAKSGTTGVFRVELATAVRFRIVFWKTKRHRLVVGADLEVNGQGSLVKRKKNKGIKLTSGGVGKMIKGRIKLITTLITSVISLVYLWQV